MYPEVPEDGDIFVKEVIETSNNVLEVLLRCYQWSIERFHATNKKFFEDIKKYPKAYQLMKNNRNRSSEDTVNFFKEGVKQGIFRDDVILLLSICLCATSSIC